MSLTKLKPNAVLSAMCGALLLSSMPYISQSEEADGFTAQCVGSNDGTGVCENLENKQKFECVIIQGQLIECKTASKKQFQCVYISGVQSSQAEFWCDSKVDALLRQDIKPTLEKQVSSDVLKNQLVQQEKILELNEFDQKNNDEAFAEDQLSTEESMEILIRMSMP